MKPRAHCGVSARPDPIDVTALSLAVASDSTRREMRAVLRCVIPADGREPPIAHRRRFDPSWSARVTLLAAIAATVPFATNLQEFSHTGATRTFLTAQGGTSHLRQSKPTSVGAAQKSVQSKEIGAMRPTSLAGVVAVGLLSASAAFAQDAVQWRVEDGGNGHWYRFVVNEVSWSAARMFAENLGGHLVTLGSAAEHAFAAALPGVSALDCNGPWIGLRQKDGAPEPDGGWYWITGEPFDFVYWAPGHPNNSTGGGVSANVANMGCAPARRWGDFQDREDLTIESIIEWSADCNNDGIVDFGQIRAGELEDANTNNIPDCCESGTSCEPCVADVDESGAVNGVDLAAVLNNWGTNGGKYPRADINGDGVVNASDLAAVLGSWGPCP